MSRRRRGRYVVGLVGARTWPRRPRLARELAGVCSQAKVGPGLRSRSTRGWTAGSRRISRPPLRLALSSSLGRRHRHRWALLRAAALHAPPAHRDQQRGRARWRTHLICRRHRLQKKENPRGKAKKPPLESGPVDRVHRALATRSLRCWLARSFAHPLSSWRRRHGASVPAISTPRGLLRRDEFGECRTPSTILARARHPARALAAARLADVSHERARRSRAFLSRSNLASDGDWQGPSWRATRPPSRRSPKIVAELERLISDFCRPRGFEAHGPTIALVRAYLAQRGLRRQPVAGSASRSAFAASTRTAPSSYG